MHLQLMHESLSRFNESFAAFLYGLNMNAFCVDFPEVMMKIARSFRNRCLYEAFSGTCIRIIQTRSPHGGNIK